MALTKQRPGAEQRVDPSEMQRRLQLAEETILTDERLRGGLTDEQFAEILQWALPLAQQAVASTASIEDSAAAEAALYEQLRQLRRQIRQAVRLTEAAATTEHAPPEGGGGGESPRWPDLPAIAPASENRASAAETGAGHVPDPAPLSGLTQPPNESVDRSAYDRGQPEGHRESCLPEREDC